MPSLGISVAEGTIVAWHKQPGDSVAYEESICDIATDKIESELPSAAAGTVLELLVAAGETVDVGTPIAVIEADGPIATAADGLDLRGARRRRRPRQRPQRGLFTGRPEARRRAWNRPRDDQRQRHRRARAQAGRPLQGRRSAGSPAVRATQRPSRSRCRDSGSLIGAHVKRSLEEAATVTSWIEVDFSAVERTPGGARDNRAAGRRRGDARDARELPGAQRLARRRDLHAPRQRQPRHRRRDRRRPDRARDRGRREARDRRARRPDPRPRQPRARRRADCRRAPRWDLHDHQPGPVRHRDGDAGAQSAPGRDPRHRGDRQAPGASPDDERIEAIAQSAFSASRGITAPSTAPSPPVSSGPCASVCRTEPLGASPLHGLYPGWRVSGR